MQTQKNIYTCFGTCLYSAGTQHRHLYQLSVTMSRVTYFILLTHTGTGGIHSQHRKKKKKKTRERLWENASEWTGLVEISKEEIPGSRRSMYVYVRTCCKVKLWALNRLVFNFCVSCTPLRGYNTEEGTICTSCNM